MERIAWGNKVSAEFLARTKWIVDDLDIGFGTYDGTSKLMGIMAFESAETFKASTRNMAGSGATGLIQFMPNTARLLGTTTTKLAAMTPEDQLNYVWKYFAPYKGRLKTLGDLYMAVLWPKGVGQPETFVLWDEASKPITFRQNAGLDLNKDGIITKAEATAKVAAKLNKGYGDKYVIKVPMASEPVHEVAYADETKPEPEVAIIADAPEPPKPSKLDKVLDALQNGVTGVGIIAGSLLLNPDFAKKLGEFTLALANGEGSWGALASVVGVGLIVAGNLRRAKATKTP